MQIDNLDTFHATLKKEGMKLKSLIHGLETIHDKTDAVLLKNIPKDLFISLVRRGFSQVIEKHLEKHKKNEEWKLFF